MASQASSWISAGFDLIDSDHRSGFLVFRDILTSDRFRSLGNRFNTRRAGSWHSFTFIWHVL